MSDEKTNKSEVSCDGDTPSAAELPPAIELSLALEILFERVGYNLPSFISLFDIDFKWRALLLIVNHELKKDWRDIRCDSLREWAKCEQKPKELPLTPSDESATMSMCDDKEAPSE